MEPQLEPVQEEKQQGRVPAMAPTVALVLALELAQAQAQTQAPVNVQGQSQTPLSAPAVTGCGCGCGSTTGTTSVFASPSPRREIYMMHVLSMVAMIPIKRIMSTTQATFFLQQPLLFFGELEESYG